MHPDAVRLHAKNVTEDGVRIPLNFQFTEPLLRKSPTVLPEPVAIAKHRDRIVTVDEFDSSMRKAEQKRESLLDATERESRSIFSKVVPEIRQKRQQKVSRKGRTNQRHWLWRRRCGN